MPAGRPPTFVDLRLVVEFMLEVTADADTGCTIGVVRRGFNLSSNVAQRVMQELVDGGFARRQGVRGGTTYVLTGAKPGAPMRRLGIEAKPIRRGKRGWRCPGCGENVLTRGPCGFCVEQDTGVDLMPSSKRQTAPTAAENRLQVAVDTATRQRVG